jgi:hypothetical protein
MNAALLGERLIQLRSQLATENWESKPWSRASLARAAAISPAAVTRLEQSGTGTAANLLALLRFYQSKGFNLAWILTPSNEQIPLYTFQDAFQSGEIAETCTYLSGLHTLLRPLFTTCGEATELSYEAAAPLLHSMQYQVHQALVHLLPLIRNITNEVDLSIYQKCLPPVAARSAGWRSRSIHLPPLHYYDAGESIPRCGVPYYYLTYQSMPECFSSYYCCPHCIQEEANK